MTTPERFKRLEDGSEVNISIDGVEIVSAEAGQVTMTFEEAQDVAEMVRVMGRYYKLLTIHDVNGILQFLTQGQLQTMLSIVEVRQEFGMVAGDINYVITLVDLRSAKKYVCRTLGAVNDAADEAYAYKEPKEPQTK